MNVTQETQDSAVTSSRASIVAYIRQRLGSDLYRIYTDAVASSVGTGAYDIEASQPPPWPRIERYVGIIQDDWLSKQEDATPLLARIFYLRAFGTEAQKKQLAELLQLPEGETHDK